MSYYEWIARESQRIYQRLPACSGEDCEARGIHKTVDSRWLCTAHAEDSDAAFDAACDGCGEHFDASFAMYDGDEVPYCSERCEAAEERAEIDMQYAAKHYR